MILARPSHWCSIEALRGITHDPTTPISSIVSLYLPLLASGPYPLVLVIDILLLVYVSNKAPITISTWRYSKEAWLPSTPFILATHCMTITWSTRPKSWNSACVRSTLGPNDKMMAWARTLDLLSHKRSLMNQSPYDSRCHQLNHKIAWSIYSTNWRVSRPICYCMGLLIPSFVSPSPPLSKKWQEFGFPASN